MSHKLGVGTLRAQAGAPAKSGPGPPTPDPCRAPCWVPAYGVALGCHPCSRFPLRYKPHGALSNLETSKLSMGTPVGGGDVASALLLPAPSRLKQVSPLPTRPWSSARHGLSGTQTLCPVHVPRVSLSPPAARCESEPDRGHWR